MTQGNPLISKGRKRTGIPANQYPFFTDYTIDICSASSSQTLWMSVSDFPEVPCLRLDFELFMSPLPSGFLTSLFFDLIPSAKGDGSPV